MVEKSFLRSDRWNRDFTLIAFRSLLEGALRGGYTFVPFAELMNHAGRDIRVVVLRHDVDRDPKRSVRTAEIEYSLGIRGTYYFRTVPETFDVESIRAIGRMGH